MNYFDLYDLPVSFHPDQQFVKQQFYALSKKYHPDFYVNESEEKQQEVLELSTLNNKAFQVLKSQLKTLQYVLELKGVITEGDNYALPQGFLMEMMDVNEAIMDLKFDFDAVKHAELVKTVEKIEEGLVTLLKENTLKFDDADGGDEQQETLNSIKDIYFRNKYVARIKESLSKL